MSPKKIKGLMNAIKGINSRSDLNMTIDANDLRQPMFNDKSVSHLEASYLSNHRNSIDYPQKHYQSIQTERSSRFRHGHQRNGSMPAGVAVSRTLLRNGM